MYATRNQRLSLIIMISSIFCLLIGCTLPMHPTVKAHQRVAIQGIRQHPHSQRTRRMSLTQTDCPTAHTARAAVVAHLVTGTHQNLIYTYNTDTSGILRRYDISRKRTTTLLSLDNATISNAQLSADGQFVLFVTQVANQMAIQMIRVDGQDRQTLYCAPDSNGPINFIDNLLWSPNQQLILFRIPNSHVTLAAPMVQALNIQDGSLQTLVAPQDHTGYIPRAWLSNTLVYMQGYSTQENVPPHDVYILDIAHHTVKRTALIEGYAWDFSLTLNKKELLLSQSSNAPPESYPLPPSVISIQEATGGIMHTVYTSHVHAVTQVRAISNSTLIFILGGRFATSKRDGLWKVNSDGSQLTQLTRAGQQLSDQHTLWSSISRNRQLYAATGYDYINNHTTMQTKVLYGPLKGGRPTIIATANTGEIAEIAGWTTL